MLSKLRAFLEWAIREVRWMTKDKGMFLATLGVMLIPLAMVWVLWSYEPERNVSPFLVWYPALIIALTGLFLILEGWRRIAESGREEIRNSRQERKKRRDDELRRQDDSIALQTVLEEMARKMGVGIQWLHRKIEIIQEREKEETKASEEEDLDDWE